MRAFALSMGALAATLVGGNALAATCSKEDVSHATACEGVFDGNNSKQINGFGRSWTEVLKLDNSSGIAFSDGLTLTVTEEDGEKGKWSLSGYLGSEYMIILKGGPTFSAYLMPGDKLEGEWHNYSLFTGGRKDKRNPKNKRNNASDFTLLSTGSGNDDGSLLFTDNDNRENAGLSHFSVYSTEQVTPVPLPAAAWFLLAGIGSLCALRGGRRKA